MNGAHSALDRLVNREEVMQICFWYQGEGFGEVFSAAHIEPFLNCDRAAIAAALEDLVEQGKLQAASAPAAAYRFTEEGKKAAGRLFAEHFSDYQKGGHGECDAGCCDGDDHAQCGDHCEFHG